MLLGLENLPKSPGGAQVPDASQDCPVVLVAVCAHKGVSGGVRRVGVPSACQRINSKHAHKDPLPICCLLLLVDFFCL